MRRRQWRSVTWRVVRFVGVAAIVFVAAQNAIAWAVPGSGSRQISSSAAKPEVVGNAGKLVIQKPAAQRIFDDNRKPEVALRPEAPMRQLHAQAQNDPPEPPRERATELPPEVERTRTGADSNAEQALAGPLAVVGVGSSVTSEKKEQAPCAWVPYRKDDGMINVVATTLEWFGYVIRWKNEAFEDCDVIWTYEYPFWDRCWSQDLYKHTTWHLRRHQKVNHFPGIGYIANKNMLSRNGCPRCPISFLMPQDSKSFLQTANEHPDWTWVIKNNWHRGIKIVSPKDVDLNGQETFIQYFVSDPLLIDGRKFDFSVFVALTSLNPLRVYMYDADWAARFCSKPYHPFDPSDIQKYVVYGTDHKPLWEIDALKQYWDLGYGFKKSLFIYLQNKGFDTDGLEEAVREVIRGLFVSREQSFIDAIRTDFFSFNDSRNLFELVRFDFIVDSNLRLYLMEVNMSPNLSADPTNPRVHLYKTILHGLFSMVGVPLVVNNTGIKRGGPLFAAKTTATRDIRVFSKECFSPLCQNNCSIAVCQPCPQCLSEESTNELLRAYIEHSNRHGYRRLVPATFKNPAEARSWTQDSTYREMSTVNQLMFTWFRGKCAQDATWCS